LLARGRDRDYAVGIWTAPALHVVGLVVLVPWLGATGAGLSWAMAQLGYLAISCVQLRGTQLAPWRLLAAPLVLAGVTAGAALLAGAVVDGDRYSLAARLAAGALVGGLGLWIVELRGRMHLLGDGLVQASGLQRGTRGRCGTVSDAP
jgi:hypothetical protein